MTSTNIYRDIATRTGGNIYIGVVGPVRTGKSTFIRKVMQHLVLDEIDDPYVRERTIDELPQASAGKTIMTTEPKFVPENAMQIHLKDNTVCNIRMVDCVGYVVGSALGQYEDEGPRMVHTPWSEEEMPFWQAAEIGTRKVIKEHSTIGVVVTTDGSFGEIARGEYIEAEKRVIEEMSKTGKPFVILLNSMFPTGEQTRLIRDSLESEYNVPVIIKNCNELTANDIEEVLSVILTEFPISRIDIKLPSWVTYLSKSNPIKKEIYQWMRTCAERYKTMRQLNLLCADMMQNQYIDTAQTDMREMGDGSARLRLDLPQSLYFSMVSDVLGKEIKDDGDLLMELEMLQSSRNEYDKIRAAFEIAQQSGYGIVRPSKDDLCLDPPESYRKGIALVSKLKRQHQHIIL